MRFIVFFLFILSEVSFSTECSLSDNLSDEISKIDSFSTDVSKSTKQVICDNFGKYTNYSEEAKKKFGYNMCNLVSNQTAHIWKIKDRHKMGTALNQCTPDKNTKALVISFAGTTSYNPRLHKMMADIIQCEKYQEMPTGLRDLAAYKLMKCLKYKGSAYKDKYDQISLGPLNFFAKDAELNKKARYFKFASFASEEMEMLDGDISLQDFINPIRPGSIGLPGVLNATDCAKTFFSKSKEMNLSPTPKLIVMGHSSGGRSAVKFLELMKSVDKEINADLVVTLDPVKEAQIVAAEAAVKKLSLFTDPTVKSEKQPSVLYKTSNSKKWINFYQKSDTDGLGMGVLGFGIHGSPIVSADSNTYIKDVGNDGHGAIVKKDKVLNKIKKEVLSLFD